MNSNNNCFSFSIILMTILCSNIVNSYEGGSKENQEDVGEMNEYTVKRVRDKKSNYTFRLYKATQIIESVDSPSDIVQYEKPIKICSICKMDANTLDRMCRIAIVALKLGEKYEITYVSGMPVEQTRVYRLQKRHSKVHRERLAFARKCPTVPAVYLTSGRSPNRITVIMQIPRSRLRRFIHRRRRQTDIGLL